MLYTYCRMQLHVPCNLSYATTQICSSMCRMQLNFSYMRQLQNPKFLVVTTLHTCLQQLVSGFVLGGMCLSKQLIFKNPNILGVFGFNTQTFDGKVHAHWKGAIKIILNLFLSWIDFNCIVHRLTSKVCPNFCTLNSSKPLKLL